MVNIAEFEVGGRELAKVLLYYGLIPDAARNEYKIICPFHNDENPSMKIDLVNGTFYCFGCNVSGDAIKFVRLASPKLDDLQALKEYFKILKSDKVKNLKISRKHKPRVQDEQYYNEAHDYYYGLKTVDWNYSTSEEVEECYKYMKARGFNAKALNLARAKITYNNSYPIIFPMFDNGVFRGWVCRTDKPDIAKKRKYLYNKGFSRATTLVGNYKNTDKVVLVEGYMDMLKMRMFGIKNVAAVLGWRVTEEQIQKLKAEGITHIISALDNDECGRKGTAYLKKFFKVTRWQYLKNCKDPGEMNKKQFNLMYHRTKTVLRKEQ